MAKKLGNDYRLWIESATPGTYNIVKGNQDLSIARSGGTIDLGTKDDFPYGAQGPGARNLSISASFIPDLPDATGFTRLETISKAAVATTAGIQVRKGGAAGATPADVVFECAMYVTDNPTSMGQNAAVTSSFTLVAAAAPTVDALS